MTGGTGCLGQRLLPRLLRAGHEVRVLSRTEPADRAEALEASGVIFVRGDLTTGSGVAEAVSGVDTIIHAASSPFRHTTATDVDGTRTLLEEAARAGAEHFVYPSIVGVDRHPLPYYRAKGAAEQIVEAGPVPWSIARATQFHELLDTVLRRLSRLPVVPVAGGFVFQPVDSGEYADVLAALVTAGPVERAPDTGGPEVRTFRDLTRAWLRARGRRRPTLPVPLVGRTARAMKRGLHTNPDRAVGTVTWEQYLEPGAEPAGKS